MPPHAAGPKARLWTQNRLAAERRGGPAPGAPRPPKRKRRLLPASRRGRILAAAAALLLLGLGGWALHAVLDDPVGERLRPLLEASGEGRPDREAIRSALEGASEEARRAVFRELRERGREAMEARMEAYFSASPQERPLVIARQLREMEARGFGPGGAGRGRTRGEGEAHPERRADGPQASPREDTGEVSQEEHTPRRSRDPEDRLRRRLDHTNPEDRARRQAYFQALRAAREASGTSRR
jgi:hypothetical protein